MIPTLGLRQEDGVMAACPTQQDPVFVFFKKKKTVEFEVLKDSEVKMKLDFEGCRLTV